MTPQRVEVLMRDSGTSATLAVRSIRSLVDPGSGERVSDPAEWIMRRCDRREPLRAA